MLRIALFLATNIAVLVLVSLIFQVLGLEQYLAGQGVHTNLTALLVFCGLFGFLGSFISLLLSKPMAKLSTRTQIIAQPAEEPVTAQSRGEQENRQNAIADRHGYSPRGS